MREHSSNKMLSQTIIPALCLLLTAVLPPTPTFAAEPPEDIHILIGHDDRCGGPPAEMMQRYLTRETQIAWDRWKATYEAIDTPEQITTYQKARRTFFVEQLGGFPERTPLNVQKVGVVQREGFHVEKIIFESLPGVFVTGAAFVPDAKRFAPPWPGVLIPCGHSENGKAYDGYQRASALMALNGMVAFIFDPYDQGERYQLLNDTGKPIIGGTKGHTMMGVGSILLGTNFARYEIWDAMRGLDYLAQRPDVDADRLGCTGNSGGGTQTSYLMALDDRVKAAAPSCYLCGLYPRTLKLYEPQDAEQNIYGQLAFGMDHADYILMRAPSPVLMLTATQDFFNIDDAWATFRYAKRLYSRQGYAERVDILENDAPHNYSQAQREGAARWMSRWLKNEDRPISEPADLTVLTEEEIQCAPQGQVVLLDGARTLYDVNRELNAKYAKERAERWKNTPDDALAQARAIAKVRSLSDLPIPEVTQVETLDRKTYTLETLLLHPENGIALAAILARPKKAPNAPGSSPILMTDEWGIALASRPGGVMDRMMAEFSVPLLFVEPRGIGETRQTNHNYFKPWFGSDGQDAYTAYLLGRSFVTMRAEDLLVAARYLKEHAQSQSIQLWAVGNVGVPALHAAAFEPALFDRVELVGMIESWTAVLNTDITRNQLINTVHGALPVYDLPDLVGSLGDRIKMMSSIAPDISSLAEVESDAQLPTFLSPYREAEWYKNR